MSPETDNKKTKICPTCGTRLSENASRCLVCGTELTAKAAAPAKKTEKPSNLQAARMPEITLSLPAALGALVVILLIGAAVVFGALRAANRVVDPTAVPTATNTATVTPTATEIFTLTPTATFTPLPPIDYTVQPGDTCGGIAFTFGVSTTSIIVLNNLDANCTMLRIGQVIKVPYPTPTPPPPPTSTLEPDAATKAACPTASYTVQANDTLSSIAANYNVSMADIRTFNNLPTDNVLLGQTLLIPLCNRAPDPNQPTPTPTPPPPYPAPNLLLPIDGAAFTLAHDIVTLQWASLGVLRDGEAYQVIIEDVTADQGRRILEYVTDTSFVIPTSFRPNDSVAHVMRWWVVPVRQTGTDEQGDPIWSPAGAASEKRVFTWIGVTAPSTTTP
ncbi:MAG: LysM peptidoglycan-binding domain-containing protein [Anaerolineaceae bacterium]|nr:MAG: LysM peptidoglycan-binding domain-containing protein [Anaerolineaceae bacterium]